MVIYPSYHNVIMKIFIQNIKVSIEKVKNWQEKKLKVQNKVSKRRTNFVNK